MDNGVSSREVGYTSEHLMNTSLWSEISHSLVDSNLLDKSVGCSVYGLNTGRDVSLFQRVETGSGTQKTSHLTGTEFFLGGKAEKT